MRKTPIFALLCCLLAAPFAHAAKWGDLTVQFTYDGAVPAPKPVDITKDKAFCGKTKLVNESLVVNPKNKGVANVVAYLYLGFDEDPPEVHPSYAKDAGAKVVIDNDACRFNPRVVLLRTTQTPVAKNSDDVGHNIKVDTLTNPSTNVLLPANTELQLDKFEESERLPATISCSIHPWMTGRLVVKDNPYMAVSDADGKLTIKNLPAGEWTIQFWHEKSGYVSKVKQGGAAKDWRRGRLKVEITPDGVDLGKVELPSSLFED